MKTALKLLTALALCLSAYSQSNNTTQWVLQSGSPGFIQSVNGSPVGQSGGTTVFYWVVPLFPAGWGQASGPVGVVRTVGISNYTSSNYVVVSWTPVEGATGYTVYRSDNTSDPLASGLCSGCGVVSNTTTTNIADQSPTGIALIKGTAITPSALTMTINNTSASTGPFVNAQFNWANYRLGLIEGSWVANDCIKVNSAGFLASAGAACGSGSGSLPNQTGNAGKYLTTDGTNASWATIVAGYSTIQVSGTAVTQRNILNFVSSTGSTVGCLDDTTKTNCTFGSDTAVMLTRAVAQSGIDVSIALSSSSATNFVGSTNGSPLVTYTDKQTIVFRPNQNCLGTPDLTIGLLAAKKLYAADGITAATCTSGQSYVLVYNTALDSGNGGWTFPPTGSSLSLVNTMNFNFTGYAGNIYSDCTTVATGAASVGNLGSMPFPNTSSPAAYCKFRWPANFNPSGSVTVGVVLINPSGSTGTYTFEAALSCPAAGSDITVAGLVFNTASSAGSQTFNTGNSWKDTTMSTVATTGCVARGFGVLRLQRVDNSGISEINVSNIAMDYAIQ